MKIKIGFAVLFLKAKAIIKSSHAIEVYIGNDRLRLTMVNRTEKGLGEKGLGGGGSCWIFCMRPDIGQGHHF